MEVSSPSGPFDQTVRGNWLVCSAHTRGLKMVYYEAQLVLHTLTPQALAAGSSSLELWYICCVWGPGEESWSQDAGTEG